MTAAHAAFFQSAAQQVWCLYAQQPHNLISHKPQLWHTSARCQPLASWQSAQLAPSFAAQAAGLNANSTARKSNDIPMTTGALDIPPTVRLGPRVEHLDVPRDGSIVEVVSEALGLSQVRQSCTTSSWRLEI